MTSTVLKAIAIQRSVHAEEGEEIKVEEVGLEDVKSEELQEITAMEFINKHHDFSKITDEDMHAACSQLQARCPKTWTLKLETRAKELNQKFMTLRMGNPALFIDPDNKKSDEKNDQSEVERLMKIPEC